MDSKLTFNEKKVAVTLRKREDLSRQINLVELIVRAALFICGFISIFTTIGIVVVLGRESFLLFTTEYVTSTGQMTRLNPVDFFTGTTWQPAILEIGIWPLLTSTLIISSIGLTIAIPLGLGSAIYLSEYATTRTRALLKPILEILAGIPTVVYGYFALTFMTPLLRNLPIIGSSIGTYNMLSAGVVMGIMVIPLIASMSEDALSAVPMSLREGAYGLGSTKLETTTRVILPAAFSGIVAAVILGMSRAVGETMIVAIAAGAGPNFTFDPTEAAETMTGYIARISGGDVSYNTLDYNSIFAIGMVLFSVTLVLNMISRYIVNRYREAYE
jgi:phosphate transport system permease protein